MFENRINSLRSKLREQNMDVALITDDDSVAKAFFIFIVAVIAMMLFASATLRMVYHS